MGTLFLGGVGDFEGKSPALPFLFFTALFSSNFLPEILSFQFLDNFWTAYIFESKNGRPEMPSRNPVFP